MGDGDGFAIPVHPFDEARDRRFYELREAKLS
jgi:hypothetical protein